MPVLGIQLETGKSNKVSCVGRHQSRRALKTSLAMAGDRRWSAMKRGMLVASAWWLMWGQGGPSPGGPGRKPQPGVWRITVVKRGRPWTFLFIDMKTT